MANTLRIKRRPSSGSAGAPSSLFNGELAFNENDNILYYGYGSGVSGAATSFPVIGGSGAFTLRGGTNASGTWPIGITGNAATVTSGVYTSRNLTAGSGLVGGGDLSSDRTFDIGQGDGISVSADSIAVDSTVVRTTGTQTISSTKTFTNTVNISGTLGQYLLFRSSNAGNYGNIVFDGNNYDGATQSSYITSNTGVMTIAHGNKISVDVANLEVKAANTSGNSVGYFAVFDTNPASSLTTLKSVSKDQILDDIGAATSGLTITAGSGLVGGGTLSTDRTFNIGQGDGISVSADSIAVDSTVVRTTGTQSIGGVKTFSDRPVFNSGIILKENFVAQTGGDALALAVDGANGNGYTTTLKTSPTEIDITVVLPNTSCFLVSDNDLLGITMTAGSGLVGGGSITQTRTFNIGQGDGITVSADAIAVDSTVVRTTGSQTIAGVKTLSDRPVLNSGLSILMTSTASAASYFPVFASDPSSTAQALAHRTPSQVKSDIGLANVENTALSSVTFTAGSGLAGGGTLASNRSFDINTGDGIQIVSDAVAVDSTVVRTTGTQSVNGSKTFGNTAVFGSGITASGTNTLQVASTASTATQFAVFTSSPSAAAQAVYTRTPSEVKTDIGLSNVTNDAQVKKIASTTVGYIPTWNSTTGDLLATGYAVSTDLTANSGSSYISRADAIVNYVSLAVGSGIATNDAMIFKGVIDCSTNPNYPAADRGWTYKISVAGKIGGASGTTVEVNDTIICTTDSTSAGTQAAVGSNWIILQTNITDASILVTGPTSATSGNFALFDGTTGKIVKDAGFAATTVGQNLVSLTNPGAITFIKLNANNTVSTESASTYRTSLGATTVGGNFFTLTNPSAVSFIRMNADNTVSTRTASELKTDLSLNNVENTALSTWAGSTSIATLGTVTTGTWSATTIAANKGGTGQSSYAVGDLLYADTTSSLAKLADVATGNALLAGGVNTAPSWGKIGLTTHVSGTLPVANGGTNQTSYTDGQLLIGNSTGNTLSKSTLTAGTATDITNGAGSITIGHSDTSTLSGAQGGNGIASFTVDGMGHVTAVTTATYLTAGTVCAAITDCTLDGGTF